jgi:hypothetical protein
MLLVELRIADTFDDGLTEATVSLIVNINSGYTPYKP